VSTAPGAASSEAAPAALVEAFWEYDRALLANDVGALDASFALGDDTLRGDGTTVLFGWEAIARFRASRSDVPTRQVRRVTFRNLADGVALAVAEVASAAGSKGMQTQVWVLHENGWKIAAAHVTSPSPPIDRSIWRVVGAPLVPPSASVDGESQVLAAETVAVKDLFAIRGQIIGGGVTAYEAEAKPQPETAPAVRSLLDAGAAVTGLARTDQFAYSIAGINPASGTPLNVQAPDRVPGGSSSGPAAAVARGWVSIGLGTDTAGSIRVPASYQGLWGIRTTHGLIDTTGILPLAPSFDTVGWLTRGADLLLRTGSVLVPDTKRDEAVRLVTIDSVLELATPAMRAAFDSAAGELSPESVQFNEDFESWFLAFRTVQAAEAWATHGAWISRHPGVLAADVQSRFDDAARIDTDQASKARAVVVQARAALREFLDGRVLLLPSTAALPPTLTATPDAIDADRARTLRLTSLASIAGVPAVSAPLLSVDGLSSGLGFVGQERTDLSLIETARSAADQLAG
jgi:Asp-tRNA(Asn)/Glu-tRNA(Gln) amidotransferase A subunit family amidase